LRREKKKRGEDILAYGGEEKRKKEMDGVFYIKGREEKRRRCVFVKKWRSLIFLLGYFTDK